LVLSATWEDGASRGREHDVQPKQLEDGRWLIADPDDSAFAAASADPLEETDDGTNPGAIDETEPGQVDSDTTWAVRHQSVDWVLEVERRVGIELTLDAERGVITIVVA
jgi:hypothetical protein